MKMSLRKESSDALGQSGLDPWIIEDLIRIGRSIFFDEIEILNWIEDHKIQPINGGKSK